MNKKRLFIFKQLDFNNKPLDVSFLPPTETMQNEPPKSVRCPCWYYINDFKERKK